MIDKTIHALEAELKLRGYTAKANSSNVLEVGVAGIHLIDVTLNDDDRGKDFSVIADEIDVHVNQYLDGEINSIISDDAAMMNVDFGKDIRLIDVVVKSDFLRDKLKKRNESRSK